MPGKLTRAEAGKLGYLKTKKSMEAYRKRQTEEAQRRHKEADKRCLNCGERIPYTNRRSKFCDHSCSATYNNKKREKKIRPCLNCGATLKPHGKKYCCLKCVAEHKWSETKKLIEKNNGVHNSSLKSPTHTMKRYLLETREHACQECGITEWHGKPINLIMDHIDGNAENWSLDNLRLVCPNCESYFPTSKGQNRGNGRKWRREARKAGRID